MLIILYLLFISSLFPSILILRSKRGPKYSVSTRFFPKTTTLWWRESSLQLANLKCRRFLYFITKNVEFCQDTFLYCKNDSYFAENPRLFLNFHESHNLDFPIEFFVFLKKNWKIFQIFVLKIFCKRSTLRKSENSSFSTFFCYKKCDLSNTVNVSMRFLRNLRNKHSRNYSQNL